MLLGVEEAFRRLQGVRSTVVGYAGGKLVDPTYKDVCTDKTGHAEVIQIEFDPSKLRYDTLLSIFFEIHDPTTRNRQGLMSAVNRSVISIIRRSRKEKRRLIKSNFQASMNHPIVTEILPAGPFLQSGRISPALP